MVFNKNWPDHCHRVVKMSVCDFYEIAGIDNVLIFVLDDVSFIYRMKKNGASFICSLQIGLIMVYLILLHPCLSS